MEFLTIKMKAAVRKMHKLHWSDVVINLGSVSDLSVFSPISAVFETGCGGGSRVDSWQHSQTKAKSTPDTMSI